MKNLKELKDILTQLEIIEEIKEPLQSLLDDINTLLHKGREWIESKVNKTYQEMKELLDSEIAKFLRQCICIASNGNEKFFETSLTVEPLQQASNFVSVGVASTRSTDDTDHEHILGQIEELTVNSTSHMEMLQTIRQKITSQEKSFKSVFKLKQETEEKIEEIMVELHKASIFMLNLSEELNESKEKEQIQDKKIQEISEHVERFIERRALDLIAKEKEKVEYLKNEIKRLTHELVSINEKLSTQECQIHDLKTEKASLKKTLSTKECEINELKTENVNLNGVVKRKDREIVTLLNFKDFKRCIKTAFKKESKLENEGVRDFWSGRSSCRNVYGRFINRQTYVFDYYYGNSKFGLSGAALVTWIADLLNDIGLSTSECLAFWQEYGKYHNTQIEKSDEM